MLVVSRSRMDRLVLDHSYGFDREYEDVQALTEPCRDYSVIVPAASQTDARKP